MTVDRVQTIAGLLHMVQFHYVATKNKASEQQLLLQLLLAKPL